MQLVGLRLRLFRLLGWQWQVHPPGGGQEVAEGRRDGHQGACACVISLLKNSHFLKNLGRTCLPLQTATMPTCSNTRCTRQADGQKPLPGCCPECTVIKMDYAATPRAKALQSYSSFKRSTRLPVTLV